MNWEMSRIWAAWICGGRYITTLSDSLDFGGVLEAVMQRVEEEGELIKQQPVVLVSYHQISAWEKEVLRDTLPEGGLTIDLT